MEVRGTLYILKDIREYGIKAKLGAHLNTLGAVPLTLPPVPVWALAGTLR